MVLLFFMDGVKYDMMKEYMPFLASINSKPLMSDFGYSCAMQQCTRAAILRSMRRGLFGNAEITLRINGLIMFPA